MFPLFALAFMFSPLFAVVDPVAAGVGVGAALIGAFAIYANRDKLGMGGGSAAVDGLITTVSGALKKVEATTMLTPLGRTAICGLVIFLGKVVSLLPDSNPNKTASLAACKTLGDTFTDPGIAAPTGTTPSNVS